MLMSLLCRQTFKGLLYADFPLDDNGIKRQNFHTWTDFLEMVPIPGLSEPLVEEICKERMGHIKALAYDVYNRGEKTTKRFAVCLPLFLFWIICSPLSRSLSYLSLSFPCHIHKASNCHGSLPRKHSENFTQILCISW